MGTGFEPAPVGTLVYDEKQFDADGVRTRACSCRYISSRWKNNLMRTRIEPAPVGTLVQNEKKFHADRD